ncbi:MAG TPA: hypothetical protein VMV96_02105 [Acidimicrobiales bacterium]|nr:hypothetical protein [Acidimicrobiales bacterium]
MKSLTKSKLSGAMAVVTLVGLSVATDAGAATPIHTTHPTTLHSSVVKYKLKKLPFKATYTGTVSLLWNSDSVTVTGVKGRGPATLLGVSSLVGAGTGSAANTCNPFSGKGYLVGAGSKLLLSVTTSPSSQACAAGQSAPTSVSVKGVAKVTGGLGKYAGAKGNLNFTGSFSIKSTTAGATESDTFTAKITGTLTIKVKA